MLVNSDIKKSKISSLPREGMFQENIKTFELLGITEVTPIHEKSIEYYIFNLLSNINSFNIKEYVVSEPVGSTFLVERQTAIRRALRYEHVLYCHPE